jgi:regulator of sigma E protease
MDIIIQIINILFWFIVILIPLVAIHEFGHLLMARLVGVRVLEFGIGIPPQWVRKRWKGIIWSLNYVLLGGFARIYGDHDAIDDAHELAKENPKLARTEYHKNRLAEILANKELQFFLEDNNLEYSPEMKELEMSGYFEGKSKDIVEDIAFRYEKLGKQINTLIDWEFDNTINSGVVFYNKNIFQKVLILMGGIMFNLITAFIIFFVLIGVVGTQPQPLLVDDLKNIEAKADIISKSEYVRVFSVTKDSNAYNAGLRGGDSLVSLAGNELSKVASFDGFRDLLERNKNTEVPMVFIRKTTGEKVTTTVNLKEQEGQPLFGVRNDGFGYMVEFRSRDLGESAKLAGGQVWNVFKLNADVVGQLLATPFKQDKSALQNVGGPVAVGSIGQRIFDFQGYKGVLNIMAVISVGLAFFNLLPIPALDGGRMVIVFLSKIFGRRNKKLEGSLIGFTMVALMGLGLIIAFNDVFKIVNGKLF